MPEYFFLNNYDPSLGFILGLLYSAGYLSIRVGLPVVKAPAPSAYSNLLNIRKHPPAIWHCISFIPSPRRGQPVKHELIVPLTHSKLYPTAKSNSRASIICERHNQDRAMGDTQLTIERCRCVGPTEQPLYAGDFLILEHLPNTFPTNRPLNNINPQPAVLLRPLHLSCVTP